MKSHLIAAGMAVAIAAGLAGPSQAQVVIYDDRSPAYHPNPGEAEAYFLQTWNRRHDERGGRRVYRDYYGPEDVIRLLERRGYRVNRVDDVGERYLVRAWRDGDDLLVSVSRRGEIVGVVHDRY